MGFCPKAQKLPLPSAKPVKQELFASKENEENGK